MLAFLFVIIVFLPQGLSRTDLAALDDDASVTNRLHVWDGALAMTLDQPFTGVGRGNFGGEFSAWYQPLWMKTHYLAALNDYLNVAAEQGLIWFFLFLFLLIAPFCLCVIPAIRGSLLHGVLSGVQAACFVAGLFTYSMHSITVCVLKSLVFLFSVIASVIWFRGQWSTVRTIMVFVFFGVTLLTVATYGVCVARGRKCSTSHSTIALKVDGRELTLDCLSPRGVAPFGVIVYFPGSDESSLEIARRTLRPLADSGFIIVTIRGWLDDPDRLATCIAVDQWVQTSALAKLPLFYTGFDVGGRFAVVMACRGNSPPTLRGVATIGGEAECPIDELSPISTVRYLRSPLFIVHGQNDNVVGEAEAKKLYFCAVGLGKEATLNIVPGAYHHLGTRWGPNLQEVSDFFQGIVIKGKTKPF